VVEAIEQVVVRLGGEVQDEKATDRLPVIGSLIAFDRGGLQEESTAASSAATPATCGKAGSSTVPAQRAVQR
jgi:hypothetical protein